MNAETDLKRLVEANKTFSELQMRARELKYEEAINVEAAGEGSFFECSC